LTDKKVNQTKEVQIFEKKKERERERGKTMGGPLTVLLSQELHSAPFIQGRERQLCREQRGRSSGERGIEEPAVVVQALQL
jgi:hypothetical protein